MTTDLMPYWVIYQYWEDGSMGEGFWYTTFQRFSNLCRAQIWIEEREHNPNYQILTAPLTLATK